MTIHATTTPTLEVSGRCACMCSYGGGCTSFAPGHALHLIQARLASATPSEWVDAVVTTSDVGAGILTVHDLDGTSHTVWNAGGAALEAPAGTPVTLHRRYHVLAVGRALFNVAPAHTAV